MTVSLSELFFAVNKKFKDLVYVGQLYFHYTSHNLILMKTCQNAYLDFRAKIRNFLICLNIWIFGPTIYISNYEKMQKKLCDFS